MRSFAAWLALGLPLVLACAVAACGPDSETTRSSGAQGGSTAQGGGAGGAGGNGSGASAGSSTSTGSGTSGKPTVEWGLQLKGESQQLVEELRFDAQGNAFYAGTLAGVVEIDDNGTLFDGPGYEEGFVVKRDTSGAYQWHTRLASDSLSIVQAANLDAMGNVVVAGYFWNDITLGGTTFTPSGNDTGVFVAKLNGADGSVLWATHFDIPTMVDLLFPKPFAIGAGPQGTIVAFPFSGGDLTLGSSTFGNGGGDDVAMVWLDEAGQVSNASTFGGFSDQRPVELVVDGGGNIVLAGFNDGNLEIDGVTYSQSGSASDAFVAKFSWQGQPLFVRIMSSGALPDQVGGVAVDASGNLWLSGSSSQDTDLGGGLQLHDEGADAWLLKLDAQGNYLDSHFFAGAGDQHSRGVALTPEGNVVAVYDAEQPSTMGSYGGHTAMIRGYDGASGQLLWSHTIRTGASSRDPNFFYYSEIYPSTIAVDPSGRVGVAGRFLQGFAFGTLIYNAEFGPPREIDAWDGYVAVFIP